jgi:hypothetical protein
MRINARLSAAPRTGWAIVRFAFKVRQAGSAGGSGEAGYCELNLWRGGGSHSSFRVKPELPKAVSRVNYSKRYETFILKTQKRSVEGFVRL